MPVPPRLPVMILYGWLGIAAFLPLASFEGMRVAAASGGAPALIVVVSILLGSAIELFGRPDRLLVGLVRSAAAIAIGSAILMQFDGGATLGGMPTIWVLLAGITYALWQGMAALSAVQGDGLGTVIARLVVPLLFGGLIVYVWEVVCIGYAVPVILMPAPSAVWEAVLSRPDTLWADFRQTFIRSVIPGFVMGCGAGFLVALAIDRSPFLQRGLLPIGTMVSAMPIVGIAPIMVMWFGFDWESKAAVVVVMTFFPMMVNTLAGLAATGRMEQDLMRSYAAGYGQTLVKLRLPAALPFIFNALKLNSTLALIGAIVAEFFGTPIVGMGFRISTEVGRLNIDMVWASILVAAVAGSASYGLLVLAERAGTFWHPAVRRSR